MSIYLECKCLNRINSKYRNDDWTKIYRYKDMIIIICNKKKKENNKDKKKIKWKKKKI